MTATVSKTVKSSGGNYASLTLWEAGEQGVLTTLDEIHEAVCFSFQDTSEFVIDGSTTDSTRYMKIRADSTANHGGLPGVGYRLKGTGASFSNSIALSDDYCRVQGIEIDCSTGGIFGIQINNTGCRVSECIIHDWTAATNARGIYTTTASITWYASNNILYNGNGNGGAFTGGLYCDSTSGTAYWYNNTTYNIERSFNIQAGTVTMLNNLAQASVTYSYGAAGSGSDYNIGDLVGTGVSPPGAHSSVSALVSFVNATAKNFHLSTSDTVAISAGTNLSSDANYPITVDIDGNTRSGSWSVGADQETFVAVIPVYRPSYKKFPLTILRR